jgi:site-specific DNA recombinase
VWSEQQVHEPLISIETFEAAQAMFDRTKRATRRTPKAGRRYLLAGLMRCGICGRRMQGQWNHGQPYYRCKYPSDYPIDEVRHPKSIYVREEAILPGLDGWLASLFDEEHFDKTCEVLAGSDGFEPPDRDRQAALRAQIRSCDQRLERYRALLDEGEALATVAGWIAEVGRERKSAEAQLGRVVPGGKLTETQTRALVEALRNIVDVPAEADPADKAELYTELAVSLTYHTDGRVAVQALPRGVQVRVGGGT